MNKTMKPRIFIGSSKESLGVAERVKAFFSAEFDCHLWSDDIFKSNESFVETLMKSASLFDFGIMIFAKDDKTTVRGEDFETPRDNTLFEYGLFLGRVGSDKAFVVAEKGVKLPSDLHGVTHVFYDTERRPNGKLEPTADFEACLKKVKEQMLDSLNTGHLGLLPSTVIAISYFDNFIKPTADWLFGKLPSIEIEGKNYTKARLNIKLPESLDPDLKDSAAVFYKTMGLTSSNIEVKHRKYPVYFESKGDGNTLNIYDMPTILYGLNKAIDLYFGKNHVGKKTGQQLAEDNEMGNFRRVLQLMVKQDSICKKLVTILN